MLIAIKTYKNSNISVYIINTNSDSEVPNFISVFAIETTK